MICTLEVTFRLKGTDKIHTEELSKFHSNIYSILFEGFLSKLLAPKQSVLQAIKRKNSSRKEKSQYTLEDKFYWNLFLPNLSKILKVCLYREKVVNYRWFHDIEKMQNFGLLIKHSS